jgi:hypothetical protein
MTEVVWFPVDPDMEMKEAAQDIIDWLDNQNVPYEWLGNGHVIEGRFRVAINFFDSYDAVMPKLFFGGAVF